MSHITRLFGVFGRRVDELHKHGTFFLVVGPSGAGKDTLLDAAKLRLADDPYYLFARRAITRPSLPSDEDHEEVSDEEFARRANASDFCLYWEAHGLKYGIPMKYELERQQGRHIIANTSREVAVKARKYLASVKIIVVTAPIEILSERLAARNRETRDDINARLARTGPDDVKMKGAITVTNNSTIDEGVERFLAILKDFRLASAD